MDSRIKIRDAIQAGKITEATSMVHQMYPELLDDDRYLFFHLQVQIWKIIRNDESIFLAHVATYILSEKILKPCLWKIDAQLFYL